MPDVRDPDRDQALPVANKHQYIVDLVVVEFVERKEYGFRKYGTALQPFNGRDFLQDIYEEMMDALIYIRGLIEEKRLLELQSQEDEDYDPHQEGLWEEGSEALTCGCVSPIPSATGYFRLICEQCYRAVPDEKLVHKQ